MVLCFSCFGGCLSFVLRHSCCLIVMAISILSIILFSVMFIGLPSFSLGGLRSWLCGTCTVCRSCPPCEPHLNISPRCECEENLNNCNCKCFTHNNLKEYHNQWNFRLMANQHNHHATQMNNHQVKHRLLLWLIGLSFFNIFILIFIIFLVIFAPTLVQRCVTWQAKHQLKRRNRLMKKFNLTEPSPHIGIAVESSPTVPTLSSVVPQSAPILKPSYANPSHQMDGQQKVIIKSSCDLNTEHEQPTSITPAFPRIT